MKAMETATSSPSSEKDAEEGSEEATQRLLGGAAAPPPDTTPDSKSQALKLVFCFIGLQVSYLTWGVMQERIMTTKMEPTPLVPDGLFPSATFCVFSNRFLAIIVAAVTCYRLYGTIETSAPLWYFTPCALSNTMSSWGQYASLKYVSFPLQTLFKSAKVIPVMLMGKCLNKAQYSFTDYAEALAITAGVAIFGLNKERNPNAGGAEQQTEIFGLMCLTLYICSDAFTSQWQDRINKHYETSTYQMMFGVNCSAIIITVGALVLQNELPAVMEYLQANPQAIWNQVITAVTSATGQMFIFYTIKSFGPVVFTIIMTTRQMISMVLSTVLFGHHITLGSYVGAAMVFSAIFYRIMRKRAEKKAAQAAANPNRPT